MTDSIEKLPLISMDIKEHQLSKLKELFPEVFTEGTKIDWEKLKLTLGEDIDTGKERFGMNWPGKADCYKTIQQPSIGTLKPAPEESVNFDTTENLFIEGDNLEVLKLLQKSYLGKVKMIYIDPPYNTGNEFIYPDDFSQSLKTYLEYSGQVDGDGRTFATNKDTNGRFHSDWLNMMYPRLFLAKNLLKDDGVIFISIDDNEVHNLRALCNEIFGEENFISSISRMMKSGGAKGKFFTPNIEYILVFAKNVLFTKEFRSVLNDEQINRYYNKTETIGERAGQIYGEERLFKASLDARPNQRYWIECPDGSFVIPPGVNFPEIVKLGEKIIPTSEDGVWKWTFDRYKRELELGNIVFKETTTNALLDSDFKQSKWNIYNKLWLEEQREKGVVPSNFIGDFENRQSSKELKELNILFDFAKPSSLISYLLSIAKTDENDIILDFFAGSASTSHAVMELNKDGGNRKFICVQIPEPTDEKSEAFKAGFKTIAEISKERIRRVITKINNEISEEKAKKSSEIQFAESDTNQSLDLGFKVFKLSESNFNVWDNNVEKKPEYIQAKIFAHTEHINPQSSQADILYELLLKSGFSLTTQIEQLDLEGKKVFSIADGELLICLEDELNQDLIRAIAERQPSRVICLDKAFKGDNADALKTNTVQIMKSKGVVNFRTV